MSKMFRRKKELSVFCLAFYALRVVFFRFPNLLDVRGEVEIFARQPSGAVGTQIEGHFIVIDGDVWMMVKFFCQVTNLVHEG